MPGEWATVPLRSLCEPSRIITYGIVKVGQFVSDGIPVIRGGDIKYGHVEFEEEKRVTAEVSNQFKRTILRGGEVLMNLIGEAGRVALAPPELAGANVSRDVAVIPLSDRVDHRYVMYCLKAPIGERWLGARLQGSVTHKVNLGTLNEFPVPLPPISEQHAIARTLGSIDDKIELNRQMNGTLEHVAQALFKFWFVDFGPVRAKVDGRWKSGETLPGMPADTWDLWPTEFKDSELGEIPDRWRTASIGDQEFALVQPGIVSESERKLWYIATGDVQHGTILGETEDLRANLPSRANMQPGGGRVWFAKMRDSPKHLWTMRAHDSWWMQRVLSTGFAGIQATDPIFESVLYCFVSSPAFDDTKNSLATGTTMQALNNASLRTIWMIVPDKGIAMEFDRVVRPIYVQVWQNALQSRTLSATRDALLPKLLSGEIRVPISEGSA